MTSANREVRDFQEFAKKKASGFQDVAAGMAAKQGIPMKAAAAELAASTRKASPAAKRKNPNLKKVK